MNAVNPIMVQGAALADFTMISGFDRDITQAIPAGDFVGIVGHTGSGKSTLLSLLLRFYAPQSGRIEIDGIPIDQIGDVQFRADIGLVPQ